MYQLDVQTVPQGPRQKLQSSDCQKASSEIWANISEDADHPDGRPQEKTERPPRDSGEAPPASGQREHDLPQHDQGREQGQSGDSQAGSVIRMNYLN